MPARFTGRLGRFPCCFPRSHKKSRRRHLPLAASLDLKRSVAGAVLHGAAAGLAGVLGEFAGLRPGDDLALTVCAGHLAGRLQGHKALVAGCSGHVGGLEINGAALAAGDGAVGHRRDMDGSRAGGEHACKGKAGEEEELFHRMW